MSISDIGMAIEATRVNRLKMKDLRFFVHESNCIEGIINDREDESALIRLQRLLKHPDLAISIISKYNNAGFLRNKPGMDVYVGKYTPPQGGFSMTAALREVLDRANEGYHPYKVHQLFESLHPYMDGNGRTGRAIWLWQMVRQKGYNLDLGFLHAYYYQSLSVK